MFFRVGPQGYFEGPLGPPLGLVQWALPLILFQWIIKAFWVVWTPLLKGNIFPRRAPGVLWGPPGAPLGVGTMSTPPDTLHMNQNIQKKKHKTCLSPELASAEQSENAIFTIFAPNRWERKIFKFFFQKSVFHDSGSRQIKAFWVVWTPLLKTKLFSK